MKHLTATLILCTGIALVSSACATKGYVREQVGSAETKLSARVDGTEAALKETNDKTAANAQAIDANRRTSRGWMARSARSASARGRREEAGRVGVGGGP